MLFKIALSLLAVGSVITAAPLDERQLFVPDAPLDVSQATVAAAITCPNGITGAKGGIVYLIHGTASAGNESWAKGPYNVILPSVAPGYDICWVDLPQRSLGDAQLTAEYVVQGVKYLAPKSATKKVTIIGHSQGGGFNPQWAVLFWPSIKKLVSNYIALAGDFKGTMEGELLCNPLKTPSCNPSVFQQTFGSNYLAAQNSLLPGGGGRALVPTTSIYTIFDDIIQPESPPLGPTSYLQNAAVFALQDTSICGPTHLADHFLMLVDPAAFELVMATLANGGPLTSTATFDQSYCTYFKDDVLFNPGDTVAVVQGAFNDALAVGVGPKTTVEPPLQPYVCARGYATNCKATPGFS